MQYWELKHNFWLEDIYFELEQIFAFKMLLRKHPDDRAGEIFRELIKTCKKHLAGIVARYSKIYGDKPNVAKMRREIEAGG